MSAPELPRAFRLVELAASHGVSTDLLARKVASGELVGRRIGRAIVVLEDDWRAYLEAVRSDRLKASPR